MNSVSIWNIIVVVAAIFIAHVKSHGILYSPPSRSSMWRVGFSTPMNQDDNALNCGSVSARWEKNEGKCGICGDPYHMPQPRNNEAGGKYGKGIISSTYISGQVIDVTVQITANHYGYFIFKICPNNNVAVEVTQECLDQHVLKQPNGDPKIDVSKVGNGNVTAQLQLPEGLTCSQCVLQWNYITAYNWGKCEDGTYKSGCGPQEMFRACSDIEIKETSVTPHTNNQMYISDAHNHEIAEADPPSYFNSNIFNFVKLSIAEMNKFDLKDGYFIVPNINSFTNKPEGKQQITYFYVPKGTHISI